MREEQRVGLDYLEAITALLQRVRNAHPTIGPFQAAELQWWWSIPRSTDTFNQLFWFDDDEPVAAVIVNDFGDGTSALYEEPTTVVTVMPDADPDWVSHVVRRGLEHLAQSGVVALELEVGRDDDVMRQLLVEQGFVLKGEGIVECWLAANRRPEVSSLHDDYRLFRRSELGDRPHHMADARRPDVEQRLQQTSLYRPDLDLVVLDRSDKVAAYGLFWYDPVTATGVVEPMRTQADHQQRGLARHILTSGIEMLAKAGAERISIGYEPDNPASGPLYRSVGFEPHGRSDLFARTA